MKRKPTQMYSLNRKRKGKGLPITLTIVSILLLSAIVWIGMNDWSVKKALNPKESVNESELPVDGPEINPDDEQSDEQPDNDNEPEINDEDAVPEEDDSDEEGNEDSASQPNTDNSNPENNKNNGEWKVDAGGYIEGQPLPAEPTYVQGILIANKKNPLPNSFAPGENKEAREAFNQMAAEAALSGFKLHAFSTYRSFDYQTSLYKRYADRDGKAAADRYSARPGYSEHQTGLAFDIGEVNFEEHWAYQSFGETEAGLWVAANAHRYGFIMRYPNGKEEITGYMYEPWHFRYVGIELAEEIFEANVTLEEYLEM